MLRHGADQHCGQAHRDHGYDLCGLLGGPCLRLDRAHHKPDCLCPDPRGPDDPHEPQDVQPHRPPAGQRAGMGRRTHGRTRGRSRRRQGKYHDGRHGAKNRIRS